MAVPQVCKRRVGIASAFCIVLGSLVFVGATGSGASSITTNTSYYVDSSAACPGSGTQASPWCDFSVVNATTFLPGDQVLLKRGDTFTSSGMILYGSGTSSNNVTVAAYGSGALPIINGNGNTSFIGVNLYDNSYVTISDLAIENSGVGILINDTTSETGYSFLGLYLSGNANGIQSPTGGSSATVSNVLVQDVVGSANTLSCSQKFLSGRHVGTGRRL